MGRVGVMVAHEPYPLGSESKCGTPFMGESGIVISSFATNVIQERFSESFRFERNALESSRESVDVKLGFALGVFVCWIVMRQWRRRPYEPLT